MTDSVQDAGVATPDGEPVSSTAGSELRTFLFADIRGYTRFTQERGDQAAAQLVAKFASLMRDVVRTRGGQVLELRGDEVLAVFSSARQALRSAVELQAQFARESEKDPSLPLPVGIGLDTGEAVPVEGGFRGEALNLASRLCNLAGPGEVLATEGVVYLGRRAQGISYSERGVVPIKGFADPVRAIRVIGDAGILQRDGAGGTPELPPGRAEMALPIGGFLGALPPGALVGRDDEWNQIMASLETVMQGSGRLMMLSGEPGIGKTRLAQEVTLKARHWGFLVATGRCYEQEQVVPYYPFLEALVALYDAAPPDIRAEIPRRWPQLGRLLPELIGFIPASSSGAAAEQEDQHLLFRAVTGLIEAIAETTPVAFLLDDLHWVDASSLKLLQHLTRYTRASRVFLFGTYRDIEIHRQHPLETALLDLSREQLVEEVEVRRLDEEGTLALVQEILGEKEDLHDLAHLVYRRTEGNAFFIHEMLRALVERGDVYRKDGHWERRKIREMEVPKSVRSVIGQRLSRLDERAQDILREASVLGQQFAFDDLLTLGTLVNPPRSLASNEEQAGWTEDEVEAALEQAMAAGLLRETTPDSYVFNHSLTQQTLYAELPTRRRKRLHLAAGQALQRLPQSGQERRAGELAWHFLEGDNAEQALPYAMLAGDQATAVFANMEAERHYRTALELAQELEDRGKEVEALEKLAGILTIRAQYDQALELLDRAARLHRDSSNLEGEACAVAQMGTIHFLYGTPEEGITRLAPMVEAVEKANEGRPSRGLAMLWAALAHLYLDSGQFEEQLKAGERAVEVAHALGDHPEADRLLLGAEVARGDALWGLGQDEEAIKVVENLIPLAEATGDLNNLVRALGSVAMYYSRRGDYDKDREYQEWVLNVSERRGDRGHIVLAAMALTTNAFHRGAWGEAQSYLERAEAIVHSLGSSRLALWPSTARAWLALRQGDLETAERSAQEVLAMLGPADAPWQRNVERLLAERDLILGQPTRALDRLEALPAQSGWKRDPGVLWSLAWIHLELGNVDEAQDLAAHAANRARAKRISAEIVDALIIQGMVMTRQGSWEQAQQIFTEVLSLTRNPAYPYSEARVLYEFGMMHAQKGETNRAQRRLKKAESIFQRLGATLDLDRTQRALASLL